MPIQTSFDFPTQPTISKKYDDIDTGDGVHRWVTWKERGVLHRGILTWLGDDLAQAIIMQRSDRETGDLGWHRYFYTSQIKNIKQIKKRICVWIDRL